MSDETMAMEVLTPFDQMQAGGFFRFDAEGPWHQIERIQSNSYDNWFVWLVGADPNLGPFFMGKKPRHYRPDRPTGWQATIEERG
jgi:hypothetical protein